MKKATDTAEYLLHKINAESFGAAYSHNTENVSPKYEKNMSWQ